MALNPGDLKMYYASRKYKNGTPLPNIDEEEDTTLTWHDAPQDLADIHNDERLKDESKHSEYLKREKVFEDRMNAKDKYMQKNGEQLLRPSIKPSLNVPRQPQSWMNIDTSYKPGIGLLGKGKENDYDVYDTDFHGGKKRKTIKNKKIKQTKKSRRSRKTNRTRTKSQTKKQKRTKRTIKF